jgi:hypothetical protein
MSVVYYRGIVKNITTKKLALVSFVSIFLGISLLVAAALKRQNLQTVDQLLFTYRVLGRNGLFLIIFGVLVAIFAIGRIIARDTKRLLASSVALIIIGDGLTWFSLQKYHNSPWRDGNAAMFYEYTAIPIAIFIFALGVIAFLIVARRLFLNKNSRENSSDVSEDFAHD